MTALTKPVRRVTATRLGSGHGCDRGRRIVATIRPGNGDDIPDLIELRPERTRRGESIALEDVYTYILKCRVNARRMERLRQIKAKKAEAAQRRKSRRIIRGGL